MLVSCSTKKNTASSRFYHAFTANYNTYFNGKTSFDDALRNLQNNHKESYSEMIYMYPVSALPKDKQNTGGPFDRPIEKGNKAIKQHSITTKPPRKAGWRNDPKQVRLQEQNEYNPFLKKCWLLIGQSQFYNGDFLQASATFSYITRHYAGDEEMVATARLWQARCYSEMNWLYESEDILGKLNTNGIPAKQLNLYAAVYANYLIKNDEKEAAIPYLKTAIRAEKNKRQRTRMHYLLGQIYTELDLPSLAYKSFGDVIRANPPYELEFAARIRQTEVFSGTNDVRLINRLERMARSEKNKDYLDQVYYAIGNIYMNQVDTANAIINYQLGIDESTQHGLEKALCQIRLGDIYFQQQEYIKAQPCFSGALASLQREYKDYERVAKLSLVLDELVVHAEAVHLQDSLQTLARMPEAERLAVIDARIEQLIKEEREAQALSDREGALTQAESQGTGLPGSNLNVPTMPTGPDGSSFYFYSPQAVAQGRTRFQQMWGRRTLEDNWRRRDKTVTTFIEESEYDDDELPGEGEGMPSGEGEGTGTEDETEGEDFEVIFSDDPHTREYYIQQLPLTPEDIEASDMIIVDGLFNMALIYKDKLEDLPLSINGFETLNNRFEENEHKLESFYQIFLMALRLDNKPLAEEYKNKLINGFPESNYAVAIADPNYEHNIRSMDRVQDSIYQATYNGYLAEEISTVRRNYNMVKETYPLASLMPKFMFLNALTFVQEGDPEGFKEALRELVERFPQADVAELAGEMLRGVLRGREMVQGGVNSMAWNLRFGVGEGGLSAADSARVFSTDQNTLHRMILLYPTERVNSNQLLYSVAAYNFANFMVKEFDLSIEEMGPMSMLTIRDFINLEEVSLYYKRIYGNDGYANVLNREIAILPISENNYETLMHGKTLDEYVTFFTDSLGHVLPELADRWNSHLEDRLSEDSTETEVQTVEEVLPETESTPVITEEPLNVQEEVIEEAIEESIPEEIHESTIKEDTLTLVADTVLAQPEDSIIVLQPQQRVTELTLRDIEEIRRQEAEAEEKRKEEARRLFEEQQKADEELRLQREKETRELREKETKEEHLLLQTKREREKLLEKERKEKLKTAQAERKARIKAQEQLRKERERAYKERLKQREKERKEKERAYKIQLKEREKARKETQKQREAERRSNSRGR